MSSSLMYCRQQITNKNMCCTEPTHLIKTKDYQRLHTIYIISLDIFKAISICKHHLKGVTSIFEWCICLKTSLISGKYKYKRKYKILIVLILHLNIQNFQRPTRTCFLLASCTLPNQNLAMLCLPLPFSFHDHPHILKKFI